MREGGGREKSIAEVFELERLAQIAAANQRHYRLQIVTTGTAGPNCRRAPAPSLPADRRGIYRSHALT
ncbi:hypothetical protein SA61_3183 [Salmonella enterica subsp. enterica serovar Agona str. 61.O.08]|nr:hypothetical protein SA61_3183 [Salmonella enterica subsp. enterica serovar Agona str. 61.O.08]